MGMEGSPEAPVYSKFAQQDSGATQFYGITVDEGWRSWILCTDMYEWSADQLLERLKASLGGWRHP